MELDLFPEHKDYSGQKVMLGLSGGINSMAVLCWLASGPKEFYPAELHLFYAHLSEHSVRWARNIFPNVLFRLERSSALLLFLQIKFIPHPKKSPCTERLKLDPMHKYMAEFGITENVVGYVKGEAVRRASRMAKRTGSELTNVVSNGINVSFPVSKYSDEWCFAIVKQSLGWYPAIYDLRWNDEGFMAFMRLNLHRLDEITQRKVLRKIGTPDRVIKHNNCLPCKNMTNEELLYLEYLYPEYLRKALIVSANLRRHWGRDADAFYLTFGRADYEKDYQSQPCEICAFD